MYSFCAPKGMRPAVLKQQSDFRKLIGFRLNKILVGLYSKRNEDDLRKPVNKRMLIWSNGIRPETYGYRKRVRGKTGYLFAIFVHRDESWESSGFNEKGRYVCEKRKETAGEGNCLHLFAEA